MRKTAEISPCGQYRYRLGRIWESERLRPLSIIMLNPSTADASIDDPTIRRCIGFAQRDGYGAIFVANLFSFRATSPQEMMAADDPIGPHGDTAIKELLHGSREYGTPILAAWGAHGGFRDRDQTVRAMAREWGVPLVCLGTTGTGHPRHPLYIKSDQPFVSLP